MLIEPMNVVFPETVTKLSTVLFALAIAHTFGVKVFARLSQRFAAGSIGTRIFYLLSEIEIVFALWAGVLLIAMAVMLSPEVALWYLRTRDFTEPLFVFVIMVVCASKPVLDVARLVLDQLARLLPLRREIAEYLVILIVGPLFGSLITEPAAMTVCALLLLERFLLRTDDVRFRYATLGLLFVNISIGGTLTAYAAPPVLMVASRWGWDSAFMFWHFGWKAALACTLSASGAAYVFRRSLQTLQPLARESSAAPVSWALWLAHLAFVVAVVLSAHQRVALVILFILFSGLVRATRGYQTELKLRESFLVGVFLAGIVVLGALQDWWLRPLLAQLGDGTLFVGAIALTAVADNAALTYLGSLVPGLASSAKYALVAGAVTGGGLTVIANAPNPAGFGILGPAFGPSGISPLGLFAAALPATLLAAAVFWFL